MNKPKIEQLADTFRDGLTDRLKTTATAMADYHASVSKLSAAGLEVVSLSDSQAVEQTLGRFLKGIEEDLTSRYSGNGIVKVSFKGQRDVAPTYYRNDIDIRHFFRNIECFNDGLIAFINAYPFDKLAESALKQCATLEDRGLQTVADHLASSLSLVDHGHAYGSEMKFKSGRYITSRGLDTSFSRAYSYGDWEYLYGLAKLFRVVEAEMGDLGASSALTECADILKDAAERFDSRSKLLEGRVVDFVMFKEHFDIRLSGDVTDTVMAFLALHSSKDIKNFAAAA